MNAASEPSRQLLRHTVATLAYRGGKVLRGAPDNFASFRAGETTRTPSQILAHIGDLLEWALSQATGHEQWNEATPSIVVSEAAAKAFWPGGTVTDRRIGFNVDTVGLPVVGVVNDSRQASLATAPAPVIYVSMRRYVRLFHTMTVVVRGRGEAAGTVRTLRDVLHGIDPNLPLYNVQTLQDIVDGSTAQARLNMTLLGVFAIAALLLATLGIYGVISYSVSEREQEIGIRVALGAQRMDVLRLIVGEGAALALTGVLIGLAGAAFATRLIQSWLFGIGRTDPATFGVVVLGMIAVALVASYVPARRAARVDPLRAMRAD